MGFATFEHLRRNLCNAGGPESLEARQAGSPGEPLSMQVDGVNMTIAPAPQEAAAVLVLVDLGAIPAERELSAMTALLDANFILSNKGNMSLCLSGARGDVVLQATYRLSDLSTDSVYQKVLQLSAFAHEWHGTYMLDEAGNPAAHFAALPI